MWIWGRVIYSFSKQVDTSFLSGWGNPGNLGSTASIGGRGGEKVGVQAKVSPKQGQGTLEDVQAS